MLSYYTNSPMPPPMPMEDHPLKVTSTADGRCIFVYGDTDRNGNLDRHRGRRFTEVSTGYKMEDFTENFMKGLLNNEAAVPEPESQDKLPVINTDTPEWEWEKDGLPVLPVGFAWANDVAGIAFIRSVKKISDAKVPKHHRMMFVNAISDKMDKISDKLDRSRWHKFLLDQAARLESLVKILRMMAEFVDDNPPEKK